MTKWVKLNQHVGGEIYVNLEQVSSIETSEKGGAKVWFLAEARNGAIEVVETAKWILADEFVKSKA